MTGRKEKFTIRLGDQAAQKFRSLPNASEYIESLILAKEITTEEIRLTEWYSKLSDHERDTLLWIYRMRSMAILNAKRIIETRKLRKITEVDHKIKEQKLQQETIIARRMTQETPLDSDKLFWCTHDEKMVKPERIDEIDGVSVRFCPLCHNPSERDSESWRSKNAKRGSE